MSKILLVEDEELFRKIYKIKLELANFKVETAVDGEEGLEKAREFKPDLILLDILMPKLNGLDVLREIKADPELKAIPVIVLTNLASNNLKLDLSQAGVAGYFIKSEITPSEVLEEVKQVLFLR